jgi:uroporphyrinogen decarboxylase
MNDRFLRACRREPVDCTPVWIMRQAGRYLPEYRAVREKYSMIDTIRTPELAVQVTLQPLQRFDLDAAIIFADILPLLMAAGIDLEYAAGEGPLIHNPVRTAADVAALRVPPAEEGVPFTLAAIRLVRRELEGKTPLIGFSGAPFTLAAYAIEGGSSRDYKRTKQFMYAQPTAWQALMDKLARLAGDYLAAQVRAGAQAVQLFDSWAGALSPADYRAYVLPYTQQAIAIAASAGAPVINFSTGTGGMVEVLGQAGGDVIGIDWRVDLDLAWERIGQKFALQGNLDPIALLGPISVMCERAGDVLRRAGGRPGHIFNLGHGVLPETPPENVRALVEFVHGWRA